MKNLKAGVIGHPIHNSKSPLIHGHWIEQHKLNGSYDAIDIEPKNLKQSIQDLIQQGFDGFNVTVPHKEEILSLCYEIDETAQAIGAVNTVSIEGGKLIGTNTDAFGFIQNIKQSQPDFEFKNKTALVLGSGGAARAVVYGLINEGASKIILTNRTRERAMNLKDLAPEIIEIIDWKNKENSLNISDLVVNTTSLGMAGQPPLDMNLETLNQAALVTDIVYAPLMTDLLISAEKNGNMIVTGIGMLLHQARPAFQKWTGIMPEVDKALIDKVLL